LATLGVVLAGTLLLAAPASAGAVKSIWGPTVLPNGRSAFPVYRDLGAQDLQYQLHWWTAAPTRPANPRDPHDPAYRWPSAVTRAVAGARRNGMTVSLMIIGSPRWANGGHAHEWAPKDKRDFADFAEAASRRYPSVKRWMIWGEPDRRAQFRPLPLGRPTGPRVYARLLDAAYGALKRVSRRNVVVGGMTMTTGDIRPRYWIRWMKLPNRKPPRMDLWGHNPFSTRFPNLANPPYAPGVLDFSDLDTLHARLARDYGARTPRLWLSEFTIQSDHRSQLFGFSVSKREQARWLTASYQIANRTPWIAGLGWIGLVDQADTATDYGSHFGLLTTGLKKKPAYYAYRKAR
jgi:hypothetical protein